MSHQQTFAPEYRPRFGSAKRRGRRRWKMEWRFGVPRVWNVSGWYETLAQAQMAQRATMRGIGSRIADYETRILAPDGAVYVGTH